MTPEPVVVPSQTQSNQPSPVLPFQAPSSASTSSSPPSLAALCPRPDCAITEAESCEVLEPRHRAVKALSFHGVEVVVGETSSSSNTLASKSPSSPCSASALSSDQLVRWRQRQLQSQRQQRQSENNEYDDEDRVRAARPVTPDQRRQGDAAATPWTTGRPRTTTLPESSSTKRSASSVFVDASRATSEPSSKRARVAPRSKHFLDTFSISRNFYHNNTSNPDSLHNQPPSPLFFSHSPRRRPALPPRFSSSEAAIKMLSKTRGEDSHVRTVSLARGTVITPQNLAIAPQPQNGAHTDRAGSAKSMSPDSSPESSGKEANFVLNSIGVTELLEQDERPTFAIDLADGSNYGPGRLNATFANSALRSYNGLEALVNGTVADEVSVAQNAASQHLQFKSWLLSASVNGESLDVCLPSFIYAGLSWSCSTLRKRMRIVSGVFIASPGESNPVKGSTSSAAGNPPPNLTHLTSTTTSTLNSEPTVPEETDYFGPAAQSISSKDATDMTHGVVDTVMTTDTEGPPRDSNTGSKVVDTTLRTPGVSEASALSLLGRTPSTGISLASPTVRDHQTGTPMSVDDVNSLLSMATEAPSFDWTRLRVSDSMPKHIQFALSVDWASTPLGPIETWSSDLRQMCNLVMASPHPAAMYWGEHDVVIYNEAYIPLAGLKHPGLMGQSYREAWSEIWDEVKQVFHNAKTTGEATMKDDDCLFVRRSNYLEETYFSWSIIPLVGRDGTVMGLYNPAFEKTRRKIAERRMLTLRELGELTSSARDVKSFWAQALQSFQLNECDSPLVLLYSVSDENDSDGSSIHSNSVSYVARQCFLEGSLGVPQGHPAAPQQIDLKNGTEGFGPIFREVSKADKPVLLEVGSKDLPESLVQGLEPRGYNNPIKAVVACPITPTTGENSLAFLVLGLNPRRPYDDDYALFIQLLTRQLATSLASIMLFEEEIRRGQKAARLAALDRIELSEQLAARTQEAIESETKFTRMAEFAPVGIFIAGSDGRITFANDTWYEISRVPRGSTMVDTWMESVNADDYELVHGLWQDLVVNKKPVSTEFRFKAQYTDRNGNQGDTWVLLSGYPEKSPDGRLKSVFGSITNISQQKWAEGLQTRKMEEAVELKRQQENFIDITSHEMRNPLSAILQCSDEISSSLTAFRESGDSTLPEELVTSCLDAAQIISLCSQHQKRIVDDILTLSKLDSQLLLVTPVDTQPLTLVQRALKMHETEIQAADIQLKLVVDPAYTDLGLDWVRLDPSRVMQVLINLTTNAIKFTGSESKRIIIVTISASSSCPSDMEGGPVKYFPTRNRRSDLMQDKDWGDGEKVYIIFTVRDTGRGLSEEEKKLLFIRFSQASPRTHVQYGGSGLGLFISRELTELQGGEIGVESEAGKGSTFAFYVIARRSQPPKNYEINTGFSRLNMKGRRTPSGLGKSLQQTFDCSSTTQQSTVSAEPSTSKEATFKPRVLIVEDNLVNQRVLQKQLKNMGTEVHLANHGGEALDKLMQSTYWAGSSDKTESGNRLEIGVVLMDQEMPVMDGLTCTRRIRELEKEGRFRCHIPIIAVTANARAEQVQTALDTGMDDVVSKPFRIPDLMPKIEELMVKYPAPSLQ